jgi:hypothetical protein
MPRSWLAVGAVALAFVALFDDAAVPLGGGVEVVHATVEQPIGDSPRSIVRVTNAIEMPVDVYVNHAATPAMTDVKALSIGSELVIEGKDAAPYGTYTLAARPKASGPAGPVIAAASLTFAEGHYFSAVLHETGPGTHQLAIYDADFAPGDGRLTIRNNSRAASISWRIFPKDVKPEIPWDERTGTLGNGQQQVAIDVTQTDYVLEFMIDGQVVGRHPDVEIEHEKNRVLTLAGDPQPSVDPVVLRRHVLAEEFQLPRGPSEPDSVRPPEDPISTTDDNAPIDFTCGALETWQTHAAAAQVAATDPDGVVTNLSVATSGLPDGIVVTAMAPASAIGGTALATVTVGGDVPAGNYGVTIVANVGSLGHQAGCTLPVTVRAITIDRLRDLVAALRDSGDADAAVAAELAALLDQAEQQLDAGATADACQSLKDLAARVQAEKGVAITVVAAQGLEDEAQALRAGLGCG